MNFQVELTSHCDLTCGYCPNRNMQRQRLYMPDDVWKKILHEYIVPYKDTSLVEDNCPPTFIGHKDGEPLLNKKLPERLLDLAAAAPDMKIDIYSHGLMLPRWQDRGKDFIDFLAALPNKVRFMLSYHPRNHDNSVNDYEGVVNYLAKVLLDPPPNIEFITVSHKSRWVTEQMQDTWRLIWAGLPITVHCNCNINPWTGLIEESTIKYDGCWYSDFRHWFFGATGNVVPCCLDLEEEIILGNVMRDEPSAIFQRTLAFYERQRQVRDEGGKPDHPLCADCFGYKRSEVELLQIGVGQ